MKSLHLIGLMALAAAAANGQPTNGAQYWSTVVPDCSSLQITTAVAIKNASGGTIGYSCQVTGTFVWLAAGAGWVSKIRLAAPLSGAVGVDYSFYDANGDSQALDVTGTVIDSNDFVTFALFDNQPSEIELLGASGDGPTYPFGGTGSVYATFYCPNAETCRDLQPQLIYLALPSIPWALSVPITWDSAIWNAWSAVGVDNGGSKIVSFVVYNEDTIAHAFTIYVYDSDGFLFDTGHTPVILPLQDLGGGSLGEGGTYGALLRDLVSLPAGPFKVLIDGGTAAVLSGVSVLQFDGPSATSLQVGFDTSPTGASPAAAAKKAKLRQMRMASRRTQVFKSVRR